MNIPALLVTGLALGVAASAPLQAATNYKLIKEIPIGGEGGWDYLSIDATQRRLYVAHATQVTVIDIDNNTVVGHIADTQGVHGIAIASDMGRGFVSDGRENKVSVVDLSNFKTLEKLPAGQNPDAILYATNTQEVYAFNGRSHSASIFSAKENKLVAEIPLPGKPEFAAYDSARNIVYDAIEDKSLVVAIDGKTHQVVATWPISPGVEPSGIAFDAKDHRLFIGCDNAMIVNLDTDSGRIVGPIPAGEGIDAVAFDPANALVFSSNGESGTVTIAHVDSPDRVTVVQTLPTETGARTMTVDPKTGRIYLASAKFEPEGPTAGATSERHRPKMIAGSFKVLVYGSDE